MAWDDPFPPYLPPSLARRREKEARQQRDLAKKLQEVKLSPEAVASGMKPLVPATQRPSTSTSSVGEITPAKKQLPQRYIMNLPDSALTFLGAYNGLYKDLQHEPEFKEALQEAGLPIVHVYCFTRELEDDTAEKDICEVSSLDFTYQERL
jgi:tRNA (guanine37-N1)-methyltransferase